MKNSMTINLTIWTKWTNSLKDKDYYNLQETECLNSPKSIKEMAFLIRYRLPKKTSDPDYCTSKSVQLRNENTNPILSKTQMDDQKYSK